MKCFLYVHLPVHKSNVNRFPHCYVNSFLSNVSTDITVCSLCSFPTERNGKISPTPAGPVESSVSFSGRPDRKKSGPFERSWRKRAEGSAMPLRKPARLFPPAAIFSERYRFFRRPSSPSSAKIRNLSKITFLQQLFHAHLTSAKSIRCGNIGFCGKMRSAISNIPACSGT